MDKTGNTSNFSFLKCDVSPLARLGMLAERYFRDDPNTCLIKLRQFGEILAQQVAARTGVLLSLEESQSDLLWRFKKDGIVDKEPMEFFHHLRLVGNKATHEHMGSHADALNALKIARQLAIWFHRSFGKAAGFKPGPFVPPPDPAAATAQVHEELERLRQERDALRSTAEQAQAHAEAQARERESAEHRARRVAEEKTVWEQLAQETEAEKASLAAQLSALQQAAQQSAPAERAALIEVAHTAALTIDLDEAATRALIDRQLQECGWDADSTTLRYADGVRPAKGKAMAIAEWPTASGPADYALFIGLQCVGVVEAKRQRKNVSTAIDQAERYSRGFQFKSGTEQAGGPWATYLVPFVFSTNGRPYLKQLETESGIWFRDVRKDTNRRRALAGWFTPDGLKAELEIDREAAQATLATAPFQFGFPLRPYQRRAIEHVEQALTTDQRQMLVAMATGTGKTKLAIALLYRLLTAKRFRRVCFVVDRNALGDQTAGEFRTTKVVSAKTFAEIFDLKGLDETAIEPETKVHICTIQALVNRVVLAEDKLPPPVDQYDLMVIDECHRGYLLDREMSDAELAFRDQKDYVSKYRQVLEYFDAVKIGLTATPALHTAQIFGDPIYTYSYREAVIDGYLIDHEPPIRIETRLSQSGILFAKGEQVEMLDTGTGELNLAEMPDEVQFDVEGFNRKVITRPFVQAVVGELARHIDPSLPGKTLIFAVSKGHADLIVEELKASLEARYGAIEDQAVRRITGDTDQVGALIRSYRNDDMPKIAVTVDLLTTGIDVPSITNLVFLRRVNSRILYEQMLGRATRQCPEIGKETFRVFDAVDLYPHLQELTQMRPVVVNPQISLSQLFEELTTVQADDHRQAVQDQIIVKLRRRLARLSDEARSRYEATAGETPEATLTRLQTNPPAEIAQWAKTRKGIGAILDWDPDAPGGQILPISSHADEVVSVTRGYGTASKPEDFLDGFTAFIRGNVNLIAALTVVVQRPRELTRAQLRELRLELDRRGYSEASLRRAWQDTKNEDIAASIIGFIRQAALGDHLIPYEDRVRSALKRIVAGNRWSDPQRKWLQRIGEQLEREIVVDREAIDRPPFDAHGGFRRLNLVFDGRLDSILSDINEELWRKAG